MYKACCLLAIMVSICGAQTAAPFKFAAGQSVYIVATDTSLRSASLDIERKTREEFYHQRKFAVAGAISGSDFVFVVIVDWQSTKNDEMALAIPTALYESSDRTLDSLRNAAVWQDAEQRNENANLPVVGIYMSSRHPSVAKDMVKRFHKEVLPTKTKANGPVVQRENVTLAP